MAKTMTDGFGDLTEVYEAMIDWPKRLAHEEPFYRRVFERAGVGSVVDVACGTGQHAAMWHGWGLQVEGADVSPKMIERARANFGEPPGLRWQVRGFDSPIETQEPFDAAICVGNSLALAPDKATVERALGHMLAAVREGGLLVVHLLNLWRLAAGPCLWQKCLRTTLSQGDVLIVKGVHRSGTRGYVDLVVTALEGTVSMQSESVPFLGLEAEELGRLVRSAGATEVEVFGGYQEQPYERQKSVDLLLVARK